MQVGGPSWTVEYGRRDGVTANITLANEELPSALNSGPQLQSNFESKGFNLQQMVALSGKTSAADGKGGKKFGVFPSRIKLVFGIEVLILSSHFRVLLQARIQSVMRVVCRLHRVCMEK